MNIDLEMARQLVQSLLTEAGYRRGLSDSIHIHQTADPADMVQEAGERDVAVQILDRESALVRQLRSAIGRIEDGTYGICLECEEEIAPKRLKAIPWAALCIDCQERADELASATQPIPALAQRTEAA